MADKEEPALPPRRRARRRKAHRKVWPVSPLSEEQALDRVEELRGKGKTWSQVARTMRPLYIGPNGPIQTGVGWIQRLQRKGRMVKGVAFPAPPTATGLGQKTGITRRPEPEAAPAVQTPEGIGQFTLGQLLAVEGVTINVTIPAAALAALMVTQTTASGE